MSWEGRKVLVTGAGGFIGSHLVERLVGLGASATALIRYNSRNDWGLLEHVPSSVRGGLRVVAGDIRDPHAMRSVVQGQEFVFHLAALIAIPYSYEAPDGVVATNVLGTQNLLEAVRREGVARFIHTSTSEVYGTVLDGPIDENRPMQAQSPYAASKIAADQLVLSYVRSFELPAVVVRPFNTFGPRQSARAIIPTIASQALAGEVLRLGSLEPKRDLTYVDDTTAGFLAAAEADGAIGEVFNLGTGRTISIGELAALICDSLGRPCRIECDPVRLRPGASEVLRLQSDPRKASRVLGWSATVSLEDGIARTLSWMREHMHGYKPASYTR